MTMYNEVMDVEDDLQRTTQLAAKDRQAGMDALNTHFRSGTTPQILNPLLGDTRASCWR